MKLLRCLSLVELILGPMFVDVVIAVNGIPVEEQVEHGA